MAKSKEKVSLNMKLKTSKLLSDYLFQYFGILPDSMVVLFFEANSLAFRLTKKLEIIFVFMCALIFWFWL